MDRPSRARWHVDPVRLVAAACVVVLGIVVFHGVLFSGEQFGFRDAGDFYYPLYERVQQEWRAGRIPLWEPEENGGTPLLGNPTAAVFYPGKLIYAALPYPWAARVYIIVHVLLAVAGQYVFLRALSVSPAGAAIGSLAYGFGAPVLTLTCNVVFLVGAAWLPLGFLAAEASMRTGSRRACAGLALVLALLTLGGDPEAAYLVVLAAIGYAFWLTGGELGPRSRHVVLFALAFAVLGIVFFGLAWLDARNTANDGGSALNVARIVFWLVAVAVFAARLWSKRGAWGLESRCLALAACCALALALAGVQVVPSLEFIARSTRSAGTGSDSIYRFSLAPFEILGAFWPNVSGRFAGVNTFWLPVVPPKHQWWSWFPSLYSGVPALILALAGIGTREGARWRGWLIGVAAVGLLASLGEYGSPLLWARWLAGPDTVLGPIGLDPGASRSPLADGTGGLYWLLGVLAPGFHSFRYPAKLMLPTCVAFSALAGYGWDEVARSRRVTSLRIAVFAVIVGAVLLAAVLASRSALIGVFRRGAEAAVTAYGPLDELGASGAIVAALVHGIVAGVAVCILVRASRRSSAIYSCLMIGVLTLDLAVANRWVVITVPQTIFDAPPRLLSKIRESERAQPGPTPFRVHRLLWSPSAWSLKGAEDRATAIVAWERDTLRPKYGIPYRLSYTYSVGTAEITEAAQLFNPIRLRLDEEGARAVGFNPNQPFVYHARRVFDMWNTRYFIAPARVAPNSLHRGFLALSMNVERVDPAPETIDETRDPEGARRWLLEEDVQVLRNEDAFPRAWVVHRARVRPPGGGARARGDTLDELRYPGDELWFEPGRPVYDPHRVAWVETDEPAALQRALSNADPDPSERVEVLRYEPQRVELAVALKSTGLVVLADSHYPGWELEVDGQPAPILRTNLAMRGALVAKGAHRLVYRYVARSFQAGVALTGVGLLVLAWTAWAGLIRFESKRAGERGGEHQTS